MSFAGLEKSAVAPAVLDGIIAAQIAVAWAGEGGEAKRLGWWRTDLVSEFGGEDLFKRLLPGTWQWAVLQGVREAATKCDAEMRAQSHDADQLVTLFSLGFAMDERLEDRLQFHKRSGCAPAAALPVLPAVISPHWDRSAFEDWTKAHGRVSVEKVPMGRRLRGEQPESIELATWNLIAALVPLAAEYPMPHYRRSL